MGTNNFYFFIIFILVLCSSCFFPPLPNEIPADSVESTDIHIDMYKYSIDYLFNDGIYTFFYDSSGDIVKYYCDIYITVEIITDKYNLKTSIQELFNYSIIDMTKYKNDYLITTKYNTDTNNSLKFILTSDLLNFKIYKIDLPLGVTFIKGLKYYEKENYFIGIQLEVKNNEKYGKLLKFDFDLTDDRFILDTNYPEVLLKDISYFNIFNDSLWYYNFIEIEKRNESRMSLVPYYRYEIYEYDLLNYKNIRSIDLFKKDIELIDIIMYNEEYIWLMYKRYSIEKYEHWW